MKDERKLDNASAQYIVRKALKQISEGQPVSLSLQWWLARELQVLLRRQGLLGKVKVTEV